MESRLDALVHYICARCENPSRLGATKLNKVLWYSDVFAFAQEGVSITGATYVKQQFGPVPRGIVQACARLQARGAIVQRQGTLGSYTQKQFISVEPPDISMFSGVQISIVDSVLEAICYGHTAASISQFSHDVVWEAAEIGEEIPLVAGAFGGAVGDIDDDDMCWARSEIDRIEGRVAHS